MTDIMALSLMAFPPNQVNAIRIEMELTQCYI
jgi:hypothetical protein